MPPWVFQFPLLMCAYFQGISTYAYVTSSTNGLPANTATPLLPLDLAIVIVSNITNTSFASFYDVCEEILDNFPETQDLHLAVHIIQTRNDGKYNQAKSGVNRFTIIKELRPHLKGEAEFERIGYTPVDFNAMFEFDNVDRPDAENTCVFIGDGTLDSKLLMPILAEARNTYCVHFVVYHTAVGVDRVWNNFRDLVATHPIDTYGIDGVALSAIDPFDLLFLPDTVCIQPNDDANTTQNAPMTLQSTEMVTSIEKTTSTDPGDVTTPHHQIRSTSPGADRQNATNECHCDCKRTEKWEDDASTTDTHTMLRKAIHELEQKLRVNTSALSSARRKKISAADSRPSSAGMGYVAGIILGAVPVLVVMADMPRFISFVKAVKTYLGR